MTDLPEPLEHVERPQPPWRDLHLTECGRDTATVPVITRDQLIAKVKHQGQQRAAFTTCMTCWQRCRYTQAWDTNPVSCLMREAARYEHISMRRALFTDRKLAPPENQRITEAGRFRDELLAIAALIDAHRDEFDEFVAGLGDTVQLDAARRAKQRRAR